MSSLQSNIAEHPLVKMTRDMQHIATTKAHEMHTGVDKSVSQVFAGQKSVSTEDAALIGAVQSQFKTLTDRMRAQISQSIVQHGADDLQSHIALGAKTSVEGADLGLEGRQLNFNGQSAAKGLSDQFIPQQYEAAGIIMNLMSQGDGAIQDYFRRCKNTEVKVSAENAMVIAPGNLSSMRYLLSNPSMESFDEREIAKLKGYNVTYAFGVATQDEFGNAFFRVVNCSPDNAGLEIQVSRTVIEREYFHPTSGQHEKWEQFNVLDILSDYTLAQDETTTIVPIIDPANPASTELFVDVNAVAPAEEAANDGISVLSSWLRPQTEIPIIGISKNDYILGKLNQTDAFDGAINVKAVLLKVTSKDNKVSYIPVNTLALDYNNFNAAQQLHSRRMNLDFDLRDVYFDSTTLDHTGAPAAALDFLRTGTNNTLTVGARTVLSGYANTEYGTISVGSTMNPKVYSIKRKEADNKLTSITSGAEYDSLMTEIASIEFFGYKIKGRRANVNKRQLGMLVNTLTESVNYLIPLLPPVSLRKPITDTSTGTDMAGPINVVRMRNSANAVTKIEETIETLRSVVKNIDYDKTEPVPQIQGFARTMVRPALYETKLDIPSVLQNNASSAKRADIAAVCQDVLRYGFSRIYQDSRYQPALDSHNGTPGERPLAVIGTDSLTASYLQVDGDTRLLGGLDMKHKIVVSYDRRVFGHIYGSFVRQNQSELDLLSAGLMANVPELVTTALLDYNGEKTNVTQAQARTLHVVTLPVWLHIEVKGLERAATAAVPFKADY